MLGCGSCLDVLCCSFEYSAALCRIVSQRIVFFSVVSCVGLFLALLESVLCPFEYSFVPMWLETASG